MVDSHENNSVPSARSAVYELTRLDKLILSNYHGTRLILSS